MSDAAFDTRVRVFLYERALVMGAIPRVPEIAGELGVSTDEVRRALQRLADGHLIVLDPKSGEVRMANPLSAVPTSFHVETPRGSFYGNCVWDGLGVVAMLGGDGAVRTACPDCNEPMTLDVRGGQLARVDAVVHFAVPARRWWDDIIHT